MNAFLAALNSRNDALKASIDNAPKPTPIQPKQPKPQKPSDPIEVRVNLMLTYKPPKIEVSFSRFPGDQTISDVKAAGFKWDGSCWWADDSQQKRDFCNAKFSAKLEPFDEPSASIAPEPPMQIVVAPPPVEDDSPFGIYKRQVSELMDYLKVEASDLQLLAINQLHKATFSQN